MDTNPGGSPLYPHEKETPRSQKKEKTMTLRERQQIMHPHNPPASVSEESHPEQSSELFAKAEGLLAAGDAAINRVLSGNSETFLRASRQQGGE